MSRAPRWAFPVAVLLTIPTVVFLFVTAIEVLAGSQGSEGVFGSAFDAWRTPLNILLVAGPVVALNLIVATRGPFFMTPDAGGRPRDENESHVHGAVGGT